MASSLQYNGVTLHLTKTNVYAQEPLYSADGSDYLGTRVTIDLDAVYSPNVSGGTGPATDAAVRAALMQPRGLLVYTIGGATVLRSPGVGLAVDVQNGPTPRGCTVRPVTERTWRVNYRVETVINQCPVGAAGLLSNRWQQTHAIGPNNLTTLISRGVSVFRTDALAATGRNADHFRAACLPRVPLNFQRQSLVVRVNEVGNVLTWETVDQERFVSLGSTLNALRYGVIDFNAVHSIASIPAGSGGVASESTMHSIQIRAIGDRTSSRAGLFTWATKLAIEKLALPAPGVDVKPKDEAIITSVLFSEHVDAPIVDLAISARRAPPERGDHGTGPLATRFLGIDTSAMFDPTGQNPNKPGGVRGTWHGEAFAAALRSACTEPTPVVSGPMGLPSNPDAFLGNSFTPVLDVSVGPPLDHAPTRYAQATTDEGPITEAKITTTFERSEAKLASSVAGSGNEPPVLLRLANPMVTRVVEWTMERAHARPPIPTPYSNDLGERLMGETMLQAEAPEIAPDGRTPIYRLSGRATYLRLDNRGPGEGGLSLGAVPWATLKFGDDSNTIRASDYKHGIADPEFTTPYVPSP